MEWSLEYYVSESGKCPVKKFIDSLSPESRAKYIFIADLLSEYGLNVRGTVCKTRYRIPETVRDEDKGQAEHSPHILFRVHRKDAGALAWLY